MECLWWNVTHATTFLALLMLWFWCFSFTQKLVNLLGKKSSRCIVSPIESVLFYLVVVVYSIILHFKSRKACQFVDVKPINPTQKTRSNSNCKLWLERDGEHSTGETVQKAQTKGLVISIASNKVKILLLLTT